MNGILVIRQVNSINLSKKPTKSYICFVRKQTFVYMDMDSSLWASNGLGFGPNFTFHIALPYVLDHLFNQHPFR